MRPRDIKIGEYYRHRKSPDCTWVKAIEIIKPGQGGNNKKFTVVKCKWTAEKNQKSGLIRYFMPSDLIKEG